MHGKLWGRWKKTFTRKPWPAHWLLTSGVSAGQIIPHRVLCNCRGLASLPSLPIGEFKRLKCDSVDANVNLFNTCVEEKIDEETLWKISALYLSLWSTSRQGHMAFLCRTKHVLKTCGKTLRENSFLREKFILVIGQILNYHPVIQNIIYWQWQGAKIDLGHHNTTDEILKTVPMTNTYNNNWYHMRLMPDITKLWQLS